MCIYKLLWDISTVQSLIAKIVQIYTKIAKKVQIYIASQHSSIIITSRINNHAFSKITDIFKISSSPRNAGNRARTSEKEPGSGNFCWYFWYFTICMISHSSQCLLIFYSLSNIFSQYICNMHSCCPLMLLITKPLQIVR